MRASSAMQLARLPDEVVRFIAMHSADRRELEALLIRLIVRVADRPEHHAHARSGISDTQLGAGTWLGDVGAMFLHKEEFRIGRTSHQRLDPTRTPREMATAWALEERAAILRRR